MAQLSFDVQGHKQLSRNLRLYASDMQKMGDFFRDAIEIIEARTDEVFKDEGSNVEKGPRWAALSPRTLKARERGWGYYKNTPNRPQILRWTGRMFDTRAKNINDNFGELSFTAKSKKGFPYPAAHQNGGGSLPSRPLVDLSNKTNDLIVKALQLKVHRGLGIFGRQV